MAEQGPTSGPVDHHAGRLGPSTSKLPSTTILSGCVVSRKYLKQLEVISANHELYVLTVKHAGCCLLVDEKKKARLPHFNI